VRSYQDSDGDGQGDLRGILQRLDYLQGLGVKGLWLSPVMKSEDHDHGYAVEDYRDIETAFGSRADLDALLAQAHARGIGVILDYVINHSAATHPLFVNSADSPANPYRPWYVWQDPAPANWSIWGRNPWWAGPKGNGSYFGVFWDQMPDFNLLNPDVVAWHHSNLRFWLNRGVDGFRFDAVGNLVENGPQAWDSQPQNHAIMAGIRSLLDGYQQRYMVCEGPSAPAAFNASCGSAFAFDLRAHLIGAANGQAADVQAVSDYFKTADDHLGTLLANHDGFTGGRVWNQVGGDEARYKLAAASNLLMPGTPFIYYGEELGMAQNPGVQDDGTLRTPMSWTADTGTAGFSTVRPYRVLSGNVATHNVASEDADPASLLNHYRGLIALRNARPSIARGSYEQARAAGLVMSYQRVLGAERSLVVFNYGSSAATAAIDGLPAGAVLTGLWPAGSAGAGADAAGHLDLAVPAQTVRVFAVAP